jgi:hypothetical protein
MAKKENGIWKILYERNAGDTTEETTRDITELTAGETVGRNCKRNCWLNARKTI